jgi:predicted small secreted protein
MSILLPTSSNGVVMKRTTMILLAATLALLSACETMDGLGRDTQKLGNNLSNAAEKHK